MWNDFEIKYGNESTYRDMLRIKRSIQAMFSTTVSTDYARKQAEESEKAKATTKFLSATDEVCIELRANVMVMVMVKGYGR